MRSLLHVQLVCVCAPLSPRTYSVTVSAHVHVRILGMTGTCRQILHSSRIVLLVSYLRDGYIIVFNCAQLPLEPKRLSRLFSSWVSGPFRCTFHALINCQDNRQSLSGPAPVPAGCQAGEAHDIGVSASQPRRGITEMLLPSIHARVQ